MDNFVSTYIATINDKQSQVIARLLIDDCQSFGKLIRNGYGYINRDDIQRQFLDRFSKWNSNFVDVPKVIEFVTDYLSDCNLIGHKNEQF